MKRARSARSLALEESFMSRVEELGGEVLEGAWKGSDEPHHVRCSAGHDCYPRPYGVARGKGICVPCGQGSIRAEAAFRARIAELGGVVVGDYVDTSQPVHVRCAANHDCYPRPNGVTGKRRQGICFRCGNGCTAAEASFRARVEELGGEVQENTWKGAASPHRVRCADGHNTLTYPGNVQQGSGICRVCAHLMWDAFYVVVGLDKVKFGITSGDPARRLADHRRDGMPDTRQLLVGMATGGARDLETFVLRRMADAGCVPVRGREYFPVRCLGTVLGAVDEWLSLS